MSTRIVPSYETHEFDAKKNVYCICVFVINEGEKLLNQLKTMSGICDGLVDVVVADGGSTDGSTDHDKLKALGVNTLLVKTGEGKLGSQMRMAFDWALNRGYEGVVVVDGNGKDGMDAIPRFVEELQSGVDHVQGSRFIPGGHHENTPLSRLLGVKLLHAPLISLASGFHYTDTTNGFRGYSSRLLSSERIGVFRECFTGYELHYYLAVEAAKEKFACKEIPVSRVYPADRTIPTKISGIKGNIDIIKKLLSVCIDGCSIIHPYKRFYWFSTLLILAIIVIIVSMNLLSTLIQPYTFSPDSYATYSLSKTVFKDFYHSPLIRSYPLNCSDILYSSSFPPLFPVLIALINLIFPMGIYAGILVNFLSLVGIYVALKKIFDLTLNKTQTVFITSVVFLSFLNIIPILKSLTSGWSLLPSIFLQILTWLLVMNTKKKVSCWRVICISILFALGALNRFDWLLSAIFSIVTFPLLFSERKKKHLFISACVFLLVISPWIYYSEKNFGVFWVSDNSRNAFSSVVISPHSFYLNDCIPGYPFYTHIGQWIRKVFGPFKALINVMMIFCLPFSILVFAVLLRPIKELKKKFALLFKKEKQLLLCVAFIIVNYMLCLGTIMLSGYCYERYHAGMALSLFIVVVILLFRAHNGFSFLSPSKTFLPYLLLIVTAFTTLRSVRSAYTLVRNGASPKKVWNQEENVQKKMEKYKCFLTSGNTIAKTYVSPSYEFSALELGAFAEIPVYAHLSMSADGGVFAKGFYERIGVDFFLSPEDEYKEIFEKYYELRSVKDFPDLYQVIGIKANIINR